MKGRYNTETITTHLRSSSSIAEICLWSFLKENQMMGYDFHREKLIDRFMVDFYCHKLKLAVELNNPSYGFGNNPQNHLIKKKRLNKLGITLLQFNDTDVMQDFDGVLKRIEAYVKKLGGIQFRLALS